MKIDSKLSSNMKIIGISLLLLVIPGSTLLLPAIFLKKKIDDKKTNRFLGI